MLQWNDGTWDHRAYWGANLVGYGVEERQPSLDGAAAPAGQWVRLAVPASAVGLEGRVVNGMAFTLYNGRATWDQAGRIPAATSTVWVEDSVPTGAVQGESEPSMRGRGSAAILRRSPAVERISRRLHRALTNTISTAPPPP